MAKDFKSKIFHEMQWNEQFYRVIIFCIFEDFSIILVLKFKSLKVPTGHTNFQRAVVPQFIKFFNVFHYGGKEKTMNEKIIFLEDFINLSLIIS